MIPLSNPAGISVILLASLLATGWGTEVPKEHKTAAETAFAGAKSYYIWVKDKPLNGRSSRRVSSAVVPIQLAAQGQARLPWRLRTETSTVDDQGQTNTYVTCAGPFRNWKTMSEVPGVVGARDRKLVTAKAKFALIPSTGDSSSAQPISNVLEVSIPFRER